MNQSVPLPDILKAIFDKLFFKGVIRGIVQTRATEPLRGSEPLYIRDALTIYRSFGNVMGTTFDEQMLRQIVDEELPLYAQLIASSHATSPDEIKGQIRFSLRSDYLEEMIAAREELYPSNVRED